jgi:hypothetical protein
LDDDISASPATARREREREISAGGDHTSIAATTTRVECPSNCNRSLATHEHEGTSAATIRRIRHRRPSIGSGCRRTANERREQSWIHHWSTTICTSSIRATATRRARRACPTTGSGTCATGRSNRIRL